MSFELPDLPYAYDALAPYMSAETLEFHHDKHHQAYVTKGNELLAGSGLEGKSLEDDRERKLWQECTALQQCRPALQPHPFLEVDEEGRRRHLAAGRSGFRHRQRSRRLRQVPCRLHRSRRWPVRFRLGVDCRQGRQIGNHEDAERRKPAGSRRKRRSWAATCGSIPTTSTTAMRVRSIWKLSSTT
jgi:hypothetical protein